MLNFTVTFVKATFIFAIFVHIRNIPDVTDLILTLLFISAYLGLSQTISSYLELFRTISDYLGLSR